jgi:hypothetical protein
MRTAWALNGIQAGTALAARSPKRSSSKQIMPPAQQHSIEHNTYQVKRAAAAYLQHPSTNDKNRYQLLLRWHALQACSAFHWHCNTGPLFVLPEAGDLGRSLRSAGCTSTTRLP